jgi:hypothetical protein
MKHFLLRALLALFLGSAVSLPAAAAPHGYDPAIVSADARWVVHADLNALRSNQLGQEFIALIEKAQAQNTGGTIGINIPKLLATVGTLTAYGTNLTPDPAAIDGTLIAQGTPDLRKIAESILLQGTLAEPKVFSEVTDLPFPAYAIADPKAPADQQTKLVVAFPPEPIVLVSKSKAHLLKARDVFRGAAPSLAKSAASPLNKFAAQAPGAYLFAASIVPTEPLFPEKAPQARILQLVNAGSIALGEHDAKTFAHAELFASSDRNAEKLSKILEGMTSLLSLAESNDRELGEFLNATKVTRENDTVTLHLECATTRLVQMTQNLRTQSDARPAQRGGPISIGKVVAEWTSAESEPVSGDADDLASRTIENVELHNGMLVTLGRMLNGGKSARFERVEIAPAAGGAPLIFRREFMHMLRGTLMQFPFPGSDGTYTLKVVYADDPDHKAKFAVSVIDPRPPQKK